MGDGLKIWDRSKVKKMIYCKRKKSDRDENGKRA